MIKMILILFSLTSWGKAPEPAATSAKSPAAPIISQVVTRSVAQVGNHVITSREVQISSVLETLLYEPDEKKLKMDLELKITPAKISALILEWMLYLEAESFSVGSPSEELLSGQNKKIETTLVPQGKWKTLEVSKSEIDGMLTRKATAKNLMKVKTEFSGISITDADAQDFFDKNKAKFGSESFQTFRDNIKSYLLQQAMQDRMKDWLEVLRRKYRVRIMEST